MVFYFRKGTKKAVTKFVTAFLWTSLGLNQGPPDYESFCVVFHVITWDVNMLIISDYWILWFAGKYVHLR